MKKGFTLVELLGVIIILSIIVVTVTPNIINTIKKANRQSDIYVSSMVYSALQKYMSDYDVFEKKEGNTYCIPINELTQTGYLESPVRYKDISNVEDIMSVKATYGFEWNYSIVRNNECISTVEFICDRVDTATIGFTPEGDYELGDEYTCKLNDSDTANFVILNTNGNKVSLLSTTNIGSSKWYTSASNISGPTDAYTYISAYTLDWTNISPINNFSFIDTANNCVSCGYNGIFTRKAENNSNYTTIIKAKNNNNVPYVNLKARLPMYSELKKVGCTTTNNSCPTWVGNSYYLNDSVLESSNSAYYISSNGAFTTKTVNTTDGIRIVIELYKFNLE